MGLIEFNPRTDEKNVEDVKRARAYFNSRQFKLDVMELIENTVNKINQLNGGRDDQDYLYGVTCQYVSSKALDVLKNK